MSIYATVFALDGGDHADGCAAYRPSGFVENAWELTGEHCDCRARLDQPIIYQGSHVAPSDDDARGGYVMVCAIPDPIALTTRIVQGRAFLYFERAR